MISNRFDLEVAALDDTLIQIGWLSRRRMEQELAVFDLTAPQYIALRCIQRCDRGCSMTELAGHTSQVSATMTGIIDRLVDAGLVQRERDSLDRRSLRVALTPAGEDLLEKVSARNHAWVAAFLETLTADERQMMARLTTRYLEILQQAVSAAA